MEDRWRRKLTVVDSTIEMSKPTLSLEYADETVKI